MPIHRRPGTILTTPSRCGSRHSPGTWRETEPWARLLWLSCRRYAGHYDAECHVGEQVSREHPCRVVVVSKVIRNGRERNGDDGRVQETQEETDEHSGHEQAESPSWTLQAFGVLRGRYVDTAAVASRVSSHSRATVRQ